MRLSDTVVGAGVGEPSRYRRLLGIFQRQSVHIPRRAYGRTAFSVRPYAFSPLGTHAGAQRRTQFAELLPQFIADEIEAITTSSDYLWHFTPDTIVDGRAAMALGARLEVNGAVSREALYLFDRESAMPLCITTDNNPGALAEQTIVATYTAPEAPLACAPLTDSLLADMYPDIFEKYRENTFAIVNLPGQPLPRFALPTPYRRAVYIFRTHSGIPPAYYGGAFRA